MKSIQCNLHSIGRHTSIIWPPQIHHYVWTNFSVNLQLLSWASAALTMSAWHCCTATSASGVKYKCSSMLSPYHITHLKWEVCLVFCVRLDDGSLCSHLHYFVTTGPGYWAWYGLVWLCARSSVCAGQVWGNCTLWTGGDDDSQAEEELCTLHTITSYSGSWYKCAQRCVITRSGAHRVTAGSLLRYCPPTLVWSVSDDITDINTVTLISLGNTYVHLSYHSHC